MTIGEKIYELRYQKNISQESLALEIGVSRQSISKWETNQANPDLDKLVLLAEYFKVSVDYLLGYESTNTKSAFEEEKMRRQRIQKIDWQIGVVLIIMAIFYASYFLIVTILQNPIIGLIYGERYLEYQSFTFPLALTGQLLTAILIIIVSFRLQTKPFAGKLAIISFILILVFYFVGALIMKGVIINEPASATKYVLLTNLIEYVDYIYFILLIIFTIRLTINLVLAKNLKLNAILILVIIVLFFVFANVILNVINILLN